MIINSLQLLKSNAGLFMAKVLDLPDTNALMTSREPGWLDTGDRRGDWVFRKWGWRTDIATALSARTALLASPKM